MTGDNEQEREGAGDEPAPESGEASAGGSVTPESAENPAVEEPLAAPDLQPDLQPPDLQPPRRFRSWAAAEEKPSLFARMRTSIGAIFKRKPKEEQAEEAPADVAAWSAESDVAAARYEGDASPDDRPWMVPRVVEDESATNAESVQDGIPWIDVPEATPEPAAELEPAAPEPAEPEPEPEPEQETEVAEAYSSAENASTWDEPQPEVEPMSEPVAESATESDEPETSGQREPRISHFGGTFFEGPTEIIPERQPPRLGFFARLFGRKSQPKVDAPLPPIVDEPVIGTNEYATADAAAESIEGVVPMTDGVLADDQQEDQQIVEEVVEEVVEQVVEEVVEEAVEQPVESEQWSEPVAAEPRSEIAESSFASVDEALPAADEPLSVVETFAAIEPEPEEPKPGLLARLFGRKSRKVERKERPSLEIEIHEDRIAAAADALDQIGTQSVADSEHETAAPVEPFASVDEALPAPVGDERFAPPAPFFAEAETVPPVASADSRPTVETERDTRPTMELAQDFGKTMDAGLDLGKTMDAGTDLGKTMDVVLDDDTLEVDKGKTPVPSSIHMMFGDTVEIADQRRQEADSGAYFGDTLEPSHFGDIAPPPEVIDKDTDEFAVPIMTSAETPSVSEPDVEADTAQVSRKSLIDKLLFWRKQQAEAAPAADGASTVVEGNPNFLFSKFRTFYNEIIRHKHQKSEFTAGFSTAIVTDYSADLSPEGAADALSKNLAAMLELQAAEATWMGGESAQRYPDAQYAMAALADETFLHQEWEGRAAWNKHLLEVKLFRSRSADVELFKRIDKLLKDQPNSAAARDLARVYLMVIAAGFKGKYRPFGLTRALADYRQRLYEYIHHGGDALMLYSAERKIFPEATERTLEGHAIGRFTSAQRWAAIIVFLLLGYTAIAHFAWSRVSADLKDVTDRIKATSTTASGNGGP